MSRNIIINSTNWDSTTKRFIYKFPVPQNLKNHLVGLAQLSLFNQFFNVSSTYGDNKISIIWNAQTPVTYTFTIPNGFYSISDLNYYLQQQFTLNNLYMVNSSAGTNIYFAEFVTNSTQYGVQLNVYAIPTSAQATSNGWTIPSGASWSLPASAQTPQVTFNTALVIYLASTLELIHHPVRKSK